MNAHWLKRHLMPLIALCTFESVMAFSWSSATGHLLLGTALLLLYWLVEWRGIQGEFEDRVPQHWLIMTSRLGWVFGFILCLVDFLWTHWTPWQGLVVRTVGVLLFLVAIGLRYWSMRVLQQSFSYDLKVADDQPLITAGPYACLRHPSYSALILWSASCALWNPSAPGLLLLLITTLPQIIYRIRLEEQMLAQHFGERWQAYARRSYRLFPYVW